MRWGLWSGAVFLALCVAGGATAQAAPTPPPAALPKLPYDAIFDFGRARFFRDLAFARHCEASFPDRFQTLNARYVAAVQKLAQTSGAKIFDVNAPLTTPNRANAANCADGGTLFGWEDKIVRLEREATAAPGP